VGRHDERPGRDRGRTATRLRLASRSLGLCGLGLGGVAQAAPPDQVEPEVDVASPEIDAEPPQPSTAGEWYRRGIELGNAGDFFGAAAAFLRSYELQPTPEALFNAGLALQNGGDAIAAIETYRRFLAEPQRSEELARAAERASAALLREVGTLKGVRYPSERPPAELHVAGVRRELDEFPLLLPPGPVVIEVIDERGERARETYELGAGEALIVDLRSLLPEPEPAIDDVDEPGFEVETDPTLDDLEAARRARRASRARQASRAKQLRTATWVGVGSTVGSAIALGTFTGLMIRERQAYERYTCLQFPGGACPEGFVTGDPEGHLRAFQTYALGTVILGGVTAGFAVGTLIVGLISRRFARVGPGGDSRVRLTPSFGGFVLNF
jgi:hypothetical protein